MIYATRHEGPGRGVVSCSLKVWLILLALLAAVGCSLQTEVLEEDETAHRRVELLTGAKLPATPPVQAFQQVTGHQIDLSLRRVTVEPSTWATFVRDDPAPLFSKDQRDWIVEFAAPRLANLEPGQRLRFVFLDRFKKNLVELELFPQDESLVYRFTQLAADKEDLDSSVNQKVRNWVTLVTLPGQSLEEDLRAFTLTDPVISDNADLSARRSENLEILRIALELKQIDKDEGERLGNLVEKREDISPENLRTYLRKRDTLQKALDQELFDKAEFEQRREQLLSDLER